MIPNGRCWYWKLNEKKNWNEYRDIYIYEKKSNKIPVLIHRNGNATRIHYITYLNLPEKKFKNSGNGIFSRIEK